MPWAMGSLAFQAVFAELAKSKNLSPSCHPCHPPKRVQTPCASAFCHPDTLFSKKLYLIIVLIIRISTYTAPITFDRYEEGYEW